MSLRVKLSPAQVSALECRPLGFGLDQSDPEDVLLDACWDRDGRALVFEEGQRDALCAALVEASNAEDGQAEEKDDVYARRAARSLAALAGKVRAGGTGTPRPRPTEPPTPAPAANPEASPTVPATPPDEELRRLSRTKVAFTRGDVPLYVALETGAITRRPVPGFLHPHGLWAFHRVYRGEGPEHAPGETWAVTHVPSGGQVVKGLTHTAARRLAVVLGQLIPAEGWGFTDKAGDGGRGRGWLGRRPRGLGRGCGSWAWGAPGWLRGLWT